jgi:NAD(P)-dependent dehydrogenase (short-subunit alcohol dehydrogenase family)
MIQDFKGKTAVLTGAGSGFGLECARIGARLGMNLVLVDVQQDALDAADAEMTAAGAQVLARRVDVSSNEPDGSAGRRGATRFGAPHFVFNNAGVGSGGLIWENSVKDWEWVLGVNLWGVIHGVRLFTPMMLAAAQGRPCLPGPHRQHRQHGRPAHAAQHGHLQREQTRRGEPDRNALPGPEAGERPGERQRVVPVLRAHRHQSEPPQQTGRSGR